MKGQGCTGAFGGMLVGLMFFSCGLIFFLVFGQSFTLRCTRPEPSQVECTRERHWLRRIHTGSEPIEGLSQAWVGESCDDDGCTYRVNLATAAGEQAFTSYYSSGYDEKVITASEINTFLADPRIAELEVQSDAGLFSFLLPLIFMGLGLGMALAWLVGVLRPLLAGSAFLWPWQG